MDSVLDASNFSSKHVIFALIFLRTSSRTSFVCKVFDKWPTCLRNFKGRLVRNHLSVLFTHPRSLIKLFFYILCRLIVDYYINYHPNSVRKEKT